MTENGAVYMTFNEKQICLQFLCFADHLESRISDSFPFDQFINIIVGIILKKNDQHDSGNKNIKQIKNESFVTHRSLLCGDRTNFL